MSRRYCRRGKNVTPLIAVAAAVSVFLVYLLIEGFVLISRMQFRKHCCREAPCQLKIKRRHASVGVLPRNKTPWPPPSAARQMRDAAYYCAISMRAQRGRAAYMLRRCGTCHAMGDAVRCCQAYWARHDDAGAGISVMSATLSSGDADIT